MAAAVPENFITKEVYENGWASNGSIVSSNMPYTIPILVDHSGSPEFGGPASLGTLFFPGNEPQWTFR